MAEAAAVATATASAGAGNVEELLEAEAKQRDSGRLVVLLDDVDVLLESSEQDSDVDVFTVDSGQGGQGGHCGQAVDTTGATAVDWLSELSHPAVLIVATATELDQLRGDRWRDADDSNVISLTAWTREDIDHVLDATLEANARSLTPPQRENVTARCLANPSPLFITHTVNAALKLRSWDPADSLPATLEELYGRMFDTLERRFGSDTVAALCRYVSLSQLGLTETELCDLLTSTDLSLPGAATSPQPPGQWPPSDWVTLKNSLSEYRYLEDTSRYFGNVTRSVSEFYSIVRLFPKVVNKKGFQ